MPRNALIERHQILIDGEWVDSTSSDRIAVVEPATEEPMGSVADGSVADVDRAVAAARRAFPAWSATPPEERREWLLRIAAALEAREDEIAWLIAREIGMPLHQSIDAQARSAIAQFRDTADLLRTYSFDEDDAGVTVAREPIGVVGAITPWNYPLSQIAYKLAPALAAGCTVVLKPSEVAPFTALLLGEASIDVGLPRGVLNIVMGRGPIVGEALAAHPDVDMVSFTGSTRAGTRVSELAASTVKRVTLELGGKSPNLILDDADLELAVREGVHDAFHNAGQSCSALTRMLVSRDALAEAERLACDEAARFALLDPLGDPREPGIGPVVSRAQWERVNGYIELGQREGARRLIGGAGRPAGRERGWYVQPTIFSDVTPGMTIARDEIFGPVLAIMPYRDEDEAVAIANASDYGLAGAVWSADAERAERVARRLRVGMVRINGGPFGPGVPFGGYKRSGNGRENGRYGLEEYLEIKALLRPRP